MKTKRFRFEVGLGVFIVLGALSLLNACGGNSSAPVSPPAQNSTPQAQPTTPPPVQPTKPPPVQATTPPPVQATTPSPMQPPPGTSTGREIKVNLKNGDFPKEIRVKAGERVVFVVTNEGTVMHTFEFPDFDEIRNKEIERGQTVRIPWVVPNKKGKWDMGCFLTEEGFHEGMEGTLIIE